VRGGVIDRMKIKLAENLPVALGGLLRNPGYDTRIVSEANFMGCNCHLLLVAARHYNC